MKVIDKDTLTNKAEILYQHTESGKIIPWSAVRVCEINNIKTVDAEVVRHGRWDELQEKRLFRKHFLRCSNCNSENGTMIRFNYCFNCGAKMDGGK